MMIYLTIDNMEFYDDALVLLKSFYPRTEVMLASAKQDAAQQTEQDICITAATPAMDGRTKGEVHEEFKAALYRQLQELTGQTLPWGDMTGVRPSKIAVELLEQGGTDADVKQLFEQTHFVSSRKTELALQVAHKELELLQHIDYQKGYSLYIGIPFCPTTCLYCSFTSYSLAMWKDKVDLYLEALHKEMKYVAERLKGRRLDTIYFGGGTPTTLSGEQLDRLLTWLEECFAVEKAYELTVEAGRPDSITIDKLQVLKHHKAGRISINPQTMNQETLDIIGRKHTVEQVTDAFWMARAEGFDNINMDLIMGLPGEDEAKIAHTLEEITRLKPDSLTVHSLAIKRAAALNIWKDKYQMFDLKNTDAIIEKAAECAANLGMEPYYMYRQKNMAGNFENVGYAVPGKECIYNILIMEEKQSIIALGAGASTKLVFSNADGVSNRIERIENVKSVKDYIERIDEMLLRKQGSLFEAFVQMQ